MRSKSGPGGYLYHYGLCELAQRQAVFVRKDKPSGRAIKSERAKVVMTAGCISKNFDIPNYIYNSKEKQLGKSESRLSGGWGDLVLLTERQDDFARGVTDYT